MTRNLLRAASFLQGPEAEAGVVAGGDEFAAIGGERKGGDGGGVGEHVVSALTWIEGLACLPRGIIGSCARENRLTAVGIEESDVAIFVPA